MLLESKGINQTIHYFSIFFKKLYDSLDTNENTISYEELEGEDFNLMNFTIKFEKSDEDHGYFIPKGKDDVKNNLIYDAEFIIQFTDEKNIVELSSHELNHCYEYIKLHHKIKNFDWDQIRETRKPLSFKIIMSIDKLLSEIKIEDNLFSEFLLVVKNTFNKEYNARISQLHSYLLRFGTDEDELKKQVFQSKTYKMYDEIEKFSNKNLYQLLVEKLGEEPLLELTNKFNDKLIKNEVNLINGYQFIKELSKRELEKYYNHWLRLFKHKNKKHYQKMMNVVKEIIKEKNSDFRSQLENKLYYGSGDFEFNQILKEYFLYKKNAIMNFDEFDEFKKQRIRIKKLKRVL